MTTETKDRKKPDRLTLDKWATANNVDRAKLDAMPDYEQATILPLARAVARRDEVIALIKSTTIKLRDYESERDRLDAAYQAHSALVARLKT